MRTGEDRACDLTLFNTGEKPVTSVEVLLSFLDVPQGEEQARLLYRIHDLSLPQGTGIAVSIPTQDQEEWRHVAVTVEKVWFEDASVWRRGNSVVLTYESNALTPGRALDGLRLMAGADAVGYPSQQDGLWVCVCGRANGDDQPQCVRCQRERVTIFTQLDEATVSAQVAKIEEEVAQKNKIALEEASRIQLEREAAYEAAMKRRKRLLLLLCAVTALALVAYLAIFQLIPYLRYQSAVQAIESGDTAAALATLQDMPGYGDSQALMQQIRYNDAVAALETADADQLKALEETFLQMGDYEDARDMAREAAYLRGKLLLSQGDVAAARSLFVLLGNYKDSADQEKACDYADALALLESGDVIQARTAFSALGTYQDSENMVKETYYREAQTALEAGDPLTALPLLEQIKGYKDADTLIKASHYAIGEYQLSVGEVMEAVDAFKLAGDYEDAETRWKAALYSAAEDLEANGNVLGAAALYQQTEGYEDALARYNALALNIARDAVASREYRLALTYLKDLPAELTGVADLTTQALYGQAVRALNQQDFETAVNSLTNIQDYEDSARLLEQARYGLAQSLIQADPDQAVTLLMALGAYKDSRNLLRAAQYAKATRLLAAGSFQEAANLFATLGTYEDSANQRLAAIYGMAAAAVNAGDLAAAVPLYETLGNYQDSANQLASLKYALAAQQEAAGNLVEAANLYATLSYQDSATKASSLYYALAQEAEGNQQTLLAARYYALAGTYQDAQGKAARLFDDIYAAPAAQLRAAMDSGDYQEALAAVGQLDLTNLPPAYANLLEMYQEATYQYANQLNDTVSPFAALPYYRAIVNYKDVDQKLSRWVYQVLGTWASPQGKLYVFRDDGSCTLDGVNGYFTVAGYNLMTGETADSLRGSHRISNLTRTRLILRENATATVTPLTRADHLQPAVTPTPAPATDAVSMVEQVPTLPDASATPAPEETPAIDPASTAK